MDFKGQKLSERISQILVTVSAVLAFLAGYILQEFSVMMKIFGSGVAVAFVGTVLDWPIYNNDPVAWRRPAGDSRRSASQQGGRSQRVKTSRSVWALFK